MKEILFRGKNSETKEWVEGSLINTWENDLYIFEKGYYYKDIESTIIKVIPETVGQDTGIKDKNGVKIFEGDIVSYEHYPKRLKTPEENFRIMEYSKWINNGKMFKRIGLVKMETLTGMTIEFKNNYRYFWWDNLECIEVIGNIHDNPELVEWSL